MPRDLDVALAVALATATLLSGCATAYTSIYRETEPGLQPPPVVAADVKVIRAREEPRIPWSELGYFKGHAPTLKEVMSAATRLCGRAGADLFLVHVEPFESRGVWKVDGRCAASLPLESAESLESVESLEPAESL